MNLVGQQNLGSIEIRLSRIAIPWNKKYFLNPPQYSKVLQARKIMQV
jgi:hypothetical protein